MAKASTSNGCVRSWVELLGENEAVSLLEKTLEEARKTDQKLTELSEQINVEAKSQDQESEEQEEPETRKKARSARA